MSKYEEIDLNKIKTYSITDRTSKVKTTDFAKPYQKGTSVEHFLSNLPNILMGAHFKQLIETIVTAYISNKQIIVMMGAHVIKCGLGPLIIQLMEIQIRLLSKRCFLPPSFKNWKYIVVKTKCTT